MAAQRGLGGRAALRRLSPTALGAALIVCVPVALGILVHRRFLGVWFWTDDFVWLEAARNSSLRDSFRDALTLPNGPTPYFRPLVDFYFFCMYRLASTNALGYQIANLALFVATGSLLGLLAMRLTRSTVAAALAGALFVVSPSYGALIAWPSGATALLSGFFAMATLLLFVVWLQDERRPPWLLAISVASFAAALLAKEEASSLPPVLLLCALFVLQPKARHELRPVAFALAPFVAVWIAYLLPQFILTIGSGNNQYNFGAHGVRRLIDSMVWLSLPWQLFVAGWVSPARWAAFSFFTCVAAIALLRRRWLLPGLYVSAVLMLAPSAFLTAAFAPRWTYLASLPWAFFVAALASYAYQWLAARSRAIAVAIAVPVCVAVLVQLAGRSVDSHDRVPRIADDYHTIQRVVAAGCPDLSFGHNIYVLPLPVVGPAYAVPAEMRVFFPEATLFAIKPEDLVEASLPEDNGCTLYYTKEAGYQAVPLPPTDESLRFLAPG